MSKGVSRRGAKLIRRCVDARVTRPCTPIILTLTVRDHLSDREVKRMLRRWLASARKKAPDVFADRVCAYELQRRGVMHIHILIFNRMPTEVFADLRRLWCEVYQDAPGGFDAKVVKRSTKAASAYLSKVTSYLGKGSSDDDGLREFWGNSYSISDQLRSGAYPVQVGIYPWGDPRVRSLMSLGWQPDHGWSSHITWLNLDQTNQLLKSLGLDPPSLSNLEGPYRPSEDSKRALLRGQAHALMGVTA